MMRSLTVVLLSFAGANFLGDDATCSTNSCDAGVECCQLPDSFQCCTGGESCIPNVGCRCREGELCNKEVKTVEASFLGDTCSTDSCDAGVACCQLPDSFECCTGGESCIPNVGCRCREGELCGGEEKASEASFLGETCGTDSCDAGVACCQLQDSIECCTGGESCIPNVGCRCREGELCDGEEKAAEASFLGETCGTDSCSAGVACCQLPDSIECCTGGESCIPNVGCRCREGELCDKEVKTVEASFLGDTCSTDSCDAGVECCQLPDSFQCCTGGESCIPNVGCRCREGELCDTSAVV